MERTNKTAILLAWNFFKGNYALNFAAIAILIVLNLLGIIPVIGMLFIMGYSILELSVQIFFGRHAKEITDPQQMQEVAARTRIGELFSTYIAQAAGAFLAFFVLTLLFGFLFGVIFSMSGGMEMMQMSAAGGVEAQAQAMQVMMTMGIPSLIILLITAVLFYFFPAVMGEVIESEDFVGAFKAVFLLFSPALWKRTFNKSYFLLILIWSLIVTAALILILAMMSTFILIPVAIIAAYLLSLYNAAIYVYAKELAK